MGARRVGRAGYAFGNGKSLLSLAGDKPRGLRGRLVDGGGGSGDGDSSSDDSFLTQPRCSHAGGHPVRRAGQPGEAAAAAKAVGPAVVVAPPPPVATDEDGPAAPAMAAVTTAAAAAVGAPAATGREAGRGITDRRGPAPLRRQRRPALTAEALAARLDCYPCDAFARRYARGAQVC